MDQLKLWTQNHLNLIKRNAKARNFFINLLSLERRSFLEYVNINFTIKYKEAKICDDDKNFEDNLKLLIDNTEVVMTQQKLKFLVQYFHLLIEHIDETKFIDNYSKYIKNVLLTNIDIYTNILNTLDVEREFDPPCTFCNEKTLNKAKFTNVILSIIRYLLLQNNECILQEHFRDLEIGFSKNNSLNLIKEKEYKNIFPTDYSFYEYFKMNIENNDYIRTIAKCLMHLCERDMIVFHNEKILGNFLFEIKQIIDYDRNDLYDFIFTKNDIYKATFIKCYPYDSDENDDFIKYEKVLTAYIKDVPHDIRNKLPKLLENINVIANNQSIKNPFIRAILKDFKIIRDNIDNDSYMKSLTNIHLSIYWNILM